MLFRDFFGRFVVECPSSLLNADVISVSKLGQAGQPGGSADCGQAPARGTGVLRMRVGPGQWPVAAGGPATRRGGKSIGLCPNRVRRKGHCVPAYIGPPWPARAARRIESTAGDARGAAPTTERPGAGREGFSRTSRESFSMTGRESGACTEELRRGEDVM